MSVSVVEWKWSECRAMDSEEVKPLKAGPVQRVLEQHEAEIVFVEGERGERVSERTDGEEEGLCVCAYDNVDVSSLVR